MTSDTFIMKKYALFFIILIGLTANIQSKEIESDVVKSLQKSLQEIDEIGSSSTQICSPETDKTIGKGKVKDLGGEDIDISIVSEPYAQELFKKMAAQSHIPFGYPENGCMAKAHEMSRLLEKEGVITVKVFVEGNLEVNTKNSPKGYVNWWYHVAPVLKVKEGNKEHFYVIDPSIFKKAVPLKKWLAIQTKHKEGKREKTYLKKRYHYIPIDRLKDLTKYNKSTLDDMNNTLKQFLEIQNLRQKGKKS